VAFYSTYRVGSLAFLANKLKCLANGRCLQVKQEPSQVELHTSFRVGSMALLVYIRLV